MEYFLVHIDGRMGFVLARDADHAMDKTAREFGFESADDCYRAMEVDSLDSVSLEDINHIRGFGGYVPETVRKHFGLDA